MEDVASSLPTIIYSNNIFKDVAWSQVTGLFYPPRHLVVARREEPEDVVQQRLHAANYKETSVSFDSWDFFDGKNTSYFTQIKCQSMSGFLSFYLIVSH